MPEKLLCDSCKKRPVMHTIYSWWEDPPEKHLCCKCYVEQGGTPADWHSGCMKAVAELRSTAGKEAE